MYNLSHFKEPDEQVVVEFMKQHPFAMLIGNADGRSVATQVPLMIEEREGKLYLLGHVTRKQDHHLVFEKNAEALVIFTGAHAYVSATWYENPQNVSTWNYSSVHARGQLRFLDEQGLADALRKLSLHYEHNNVHSATTFDNLPEDYTARLMKAIVGFEIEVTSLEHVFKLSQNRDEKSYHHIIDHLKAEGGEAAEVAKVMEERKDKVFKK
ncbi:FMN-binding negative transcriptional regulator [Lacibacter sediminis]|uniref:FMN-binding negative transcriptional regulator n=1 Tax=Lacibacter sediminis TaxID=2760713 RepID=A0A7G5XKY9_9BACT|nr:FMN-binding negative transcriptional regulator [Lacibacter sediminis]QNA46142.1 FMN-binding negative transcriptional regulator [Lacibacter sediminis]